MTYENGGRTAVTGIWLAARIAPGLPVPLWAYLNLGRVCGQPETRRRFLTDPLGLRAYPLAFPGFLGVRHLLASPIAA